MAPGKSKGPGCYKFDFGYYDYKHKRYYHADHLHDPLGNRNIGPMTVKCSTEAYWLQDYVDVDKVVWCVTCDKWGFGAPGPKPDPAPRERWLDDN